jgi:hypothetical protein
VAERGRAGLAALVLGAQAALALPVCGAEVPPFESLRFEEDWSQIDDTADLDVAPYKHVDLDPGGEIWASLGGELRTRGEAWHHFELRREDDGLGVHRMRLHAEFDFVDRLRMFSEVLGALAGGRSLPGGDDAETDELTLQNAFAELRPAGRARPGLRLRAGRQELALGSRRLIGVADFRNAGRRTFEGGTLAWVSHELTVTGFLLYPVEARQGERNDASHDPFFGIWLTSARTALSLDLYALGLDRDRVLRPPPPSLLAIEVHDRRYTSGARLRLERGGGSLEIEAGTQWGRRDRTPGGSGGISAWFASAELGHRATSGLSPRLWLGVDYASGGESLLDPDTFEPPFPDEHVFLGRAHAVGRANLLAVRTGLEIQPAHTITALLELHAFWRADDGDALYAPSGEILRLPASERFVGVETDLVLRWSPSRHWTFELGYAHLFAGEFVRATGPGSSLAFGYAELTFRF